MSWGNKLLIVFVLFGSGMIYLVYRCMNTEFELVEKDYYKNELTYQQVIDASQRAGELTGVVKLTETQNGIQLLFPAEMKGRELHGDVWFYCAYDSHKDKRAQLRTDQDAIQFFQPGYLSPGTYLARISWSDGHENYYAERSIIIR